VRWPAILSLVATILVAAGCASTTTSNRIADDLVAGSPGCGFELEEKVVLGRASLSILRGLTALAGDELDDDTREALRAIRRVEATTFRLAPACDQPEWNGLLRSRLAAESWRPIVSTVEPGGGFRWVLTRDGPDGVAAGLLVIALDLDELEVVRLDGDVNRVLLAAVTADPDSVRGLVDDRS
jgi:hypothetical protein